MNVLLTITGLGVVAMLTEIFRVRKVLTWLVIPVMLVAIVVNFADWNSFSRYYHDMVFIDNYAVAFTGVLTGITLLWFLLAGNHYQSLTSIADSYAIVLFSLVGGILLVSYADLSMLFIGIEILSISFYILASSNKAELRSNEAGFKYFLMGAFATGFLLFGIALIYGASGTFNLQALATYVASHTGNLPGIFVAGMLLMLVGLTFKISAVPFHFWAPDVYEGSPTLITTLMATMVKTAAFAALYRLFSTCFAPVAEWWSTVLWMMAAASMLTGNILAVAQTSLKRMLAYSSISHAGYMLLAIVALNDLSASALLLYTVAYSIASIASFTILYQVSKQTGDESITGLKGLAKAHPVQAFVLVLTMLSMAGIPPMVGFFAKYYIFYAALKSGYTGLVILAVVSSLIGVYYYLRVIFTIFQKADHHREAYHFVPIQTILLLITGFLVILLGLLPNILISLLK